MAWTAPKTWNVGDPMTAGDLNTFVRDNSAFLYGDGAPVYCAPAGSFAFYPNVGYPQSQVEKHGNLVHLSGLLYTTAATAANATVFTTPYPPAHNASVVCPLSTGGFVQLQIQSGGAVLAQAAIASGVLLALCGVYSLIA